MKISIYGEETKVFEGRLLGILTKQYFCNLMENTYLGKNLRTTQALSFKDIYKGNHKNRRLAFALPNSLLVSDLITQVQYEPKILTCVTRSSEFLIIEE